MADTIYASNDALTMKAWGKKLQMEALKQTYVFKFMGTSENSLLYRRNELEKNSGDQITYGLSTLLSGDGVTSEQTLEGNEESVTTYSDSIVVNELYHAVRVPGKMTISNQRVPFNTWEIGKERLAKWFANRFDTVFFNQICGNSIVTDGRYTGFNTISAPSATRLFRPNARANDGALVSGDEFTVAHIDQAVNIAKTTSPVFEPIMVDGEPMFVMFIHPNQTRSLRASGATNGSWADIQKALLQGGDRMSNPIFKGSLGIWNGVVLHEATRVPNGNNAGVAVANTRRAVLCGAQAATVAFGQSMGSGQHFVMVSDDFNYKRQHGIGGGTVFGLKKNIFNSVDFSTIVVPTYAVEPV